MTAQDKLPVLAFPTPKSRPKPKVLARANPDDLARAIDALRDALEAELRKPKPLQEITPEPESFSPIGAPTWRASDRKAAHPGSGRAGVAAGAVASNGPDLDRDLLARRIIAIHLPRFAMERWQRWAMQQGDPPPDDLAVALAIEGPHGPIIHATNRPAELEGVHIGARVVDMRALCPDLKIEFADVGGDKRTLEKLMHWCRRWCPWTAVDGAAGLVMDTTGSDHLFGGEAQMMRDIEEKLSHLGLSANLAAAPTHGAAWALSRFGGVREICSPDMLHAHMAPLPTRALRLEPDTILLLKRLGLKSIGDLDAVPRVSLARRFNTAPLAQNPLLRLDQMMGKLAEPVNAPDDPPRFAVQSKLAEPVQDPTPYLPQLCEELCKGLHAEGFGARRVTLTIYRTDGEVAYVTVATAQASRDADHLRRLFDGKLDHINPGFGFDLITLAASVAEHLHTHQTRLDGGVDDGAELARLIDRLSARLGAHNIRCALPLASHMPERTEEWHSALERAPQTAVLRPERPIRLFDPPEEVRVLYAVPEGPPAQFVWRRITHRVTRFSGPERIAPEWWRDRPGTRLRDYYRVEDHFGQRFWLYRDGVMGDGRGATPRWFIHGSFV